MWSPILLAVAAILAAGSCNGFDWDEQTALDEYVHRDDGAFQWTVLRSYRFETERVSVYILNMTSQFWMTPSFSSRHQWWHFMGVAVPDVITRDFAYMHITGGNNNDGAQPPAADDELVTLVKTISSISGYFSAFIKQVPNQGVVFANDPSQTSRSEDAFIAWTWKTFLETHQDTPEVIARMPFTKAAKRGLDAIREFILSFLPGHVIDQFSIGGESKRGWTSWSLAATDRRVISVTPIVMSLLNMNDTLQAHYRNLGGWTFVFDDYYAVNLTQHFHDDKVTNWVNGLWNYEDMFRYEERLRLIPKLMVAATGDEFFIPTDTYTWWDQMGGQKWIMMNPNVGHSLGNRGDLATETITAWLMLLLEDTLPSVPQLTWQRTITATGGGHIRLNIDSVPDSITAWVAHTWKNETKKDFRMAAGSPPSEHSVPWTETPVTTIDTLTYEVEVAQDLPGFGGIFIETLWTSLVPGLTLRLTTEVQVTPDTYPFPACYGSACWGVLV